MSRTETIYFLRIISLDTYGMNVNMDKESEVVCRKAHNQPILVAGDCQTLSITTNNMTNIQLWPYKNTVLFYSCFYSMLSAGPSGRAV